MRGGCYITVTEPRRCQYRVREIHMSLTGHFVRRTSSPSPDFLPSRRTFPCKMSSNIKLFAQHFKLFPGHLVVLDLLSLDILSCNMTCPASLANFAYSASTVDWKIRPIFSLWTVDVRTLAQRKKGVSRPRKKGYSNAVDCSQTPIHVLL